MQTKITSVTTAENKYSVCESKHEWINKSIGAKCVSIDELNINYNEYTFDCVISAVHPTKWISLYNIPFHYGAELMMYVYVEGSSGRTTTTAMLESNHNYWCVPSKRGEFIRFKWH